MVDDLDNSSYCQKTLCLPDSIRSPNWGYRGSGGIASNSYDLYKYVMALRTHKLLDEKRLNMLWKPHLKLGSGIVSGYGWFTSKTSRMTQEIWSRGGKSFGLNAVIRWFLSEEVLIIVQSNAGKLDGKEEANRYISNVVLKIIFSE